MSEQISELGAIFDPFPYECEYYPDDCDHRYPFGWMGESHSYIRFRPREQYEQNFGLYMAAWEAGIPRGHR